MKDTIKDLIVQIAGEKDTDLQGAMRDFLTDLRHAADDMKLDFYKALDGSYTVYLEEKP
jgi:hypothetical protein